MEANQSRWPREWLMTDERIGDSLWEVLESLPEGTGVVFRHYGILGGERAALANGVAQRCRLRRLMLAVAGDLELAEDLGASLVHNPAPGPGILPFSRSAHSRHEAEAAWNAGASLIFLSPMFTTRSHPKAPALSVDEARGIVHACPVPVIALGGMNRARFANLQRDGFYGWAGIDAWLPAGGGQVSSE